MTDGRRSSRPFESPPVYLGAFFKASPSASLNLFLLASNNGVDFQLIPSSYTPTAGHVVRDPSIVRIGSTLWLAHTNESFAPGHTFDIAKSEDGGATWSFVTEVECSSIVGDNDDSNTWAPEWFVDVDGSVHVIVSLKGTSSTQGFSLYEVHPTNAGFTTWSAPDELLNVSGSQVAFNIIDAFIVKRGSTYFLWYKASNDGTIQYASSAALLTGYTVQTSGNWAGFAAADPDNGITKKEGPALIALPDGTWLIYLDNEGRNMFYSIGTSDWSSWSAPVLLPAINGGKFKPQHGTVIQLR